jgi:hypothetical protein
VSDSSILAVGRFRRDEYDRLVDLGLFQDERIELIEATTYSAAPSPRCGQTRLNTSTRQIDGTTNSSVASIAGAKNPALGPSASRAWHAATERE